MRPRLNLYDTQEINQAKAVKSTDKTYKALNQATFRSNRIFLKRLIGENEKKQSEVYENRFCVFAAI